MRRWIAAAFMLLACSLGHAREECAIENGESYSELPQAGVSAKRGPSDIRKGQRYEVGKVQDGWVAVNADGEFAWAKASIFAYSCTPAVGYGGHRSIATESQNLRSQAQANVKAPSKARTSASRRKHHLI